jgi:hypothetical protein
MIGGPVPVCREATPRATDTRTYTPTSTPTPISTLTRTYTPTPTPTRTYTPTSGTTITATPSVSTTPGTSTTPAATDTPCAISFSDVHPSDYFYGAVSYLYCHGAISGYSDGSFRPYNNTTRGQLCKIVILAEGWVVICPQTPTFVDVPVDDPFYCYIETADRHNLISGYAGNVFHPNYNITRGQLTKVIVLAEQWTIYTPPSPTFTDVTTVNPFYQYIETAYAHNIISGYSCGNPEEPCPGLYFRPNSLTTRGQISKIVYMAVTQP